MDLVPSSALAPIVLGVVLLVGVLAGRAKRRWALLVAGVLAVAVLGGAVTALADGARADPAVGITAFYRIVVPLGVAFVAGWLCGRGPWLRRLVVLAAAVLLLAAFPYEAAGRATADALRGSAVLPAAASGRCLPVLSTACPVVVAPATGGPIG